MVFLASYAIILRVMRYITLINYRTILLLLFIYIKYGIFSLIWVEGYIIYLIVMLIFIYISFFIDIIILLNTYSISNHYINI